MVVTWLRPARRHNTGTGVTQWEEPEEVTAVAGCVRLRARCVVLAPARVRVSVVNDVM